MRFKQGVDLRGIQPELVLGMYVAADVFAQLGREMVITAAKDGVHKVGSKHYIGQAVDIRTRDLATTMVDQIVSKIRERLDEQFDIVLEKDHIHLEFDPK